MQDTHTIAFLIPVAVGVAAIICTILIHALPLSATINIVRREKRLGRVGVRFWLDTGIVARAMLYALAAHLIEIAFWAVLFVICGEFSDFRTAYPSSRAEHRWSRSLVDISNSASACDPGSRRICPSS